MKVLLTGGAGYVGSHTLLALLQVGFDVVVLDNLCNSSPESLNRITHLSQRRFNFVEGDIRDSALMRRVFESHDVEAVLHFAGFKAVGESVLHPLRYYDNNVHGSQVLLQAMVDAGVFTLVFSSSATVYGDPVQIPISEECPVGQPTNPYGRSKLVVEGMLRDLARSDARWRVAILRYFNPVGAHVWNLGTGRGYSVLEMVRAFEAASGRRVPYRVAPRRPGDVSTCCADPAKAERELGWKAQRGLEEMVRDTWRWQSMNLNGFRS